MLKASFDLRQLDRSIAKAAKNFGETNKTAVARWGVATCRELALSTQPFGNGGMRSVCNPVDARAFNRAKGKKLNSPDEISQWVDEHRTGSRGHARLNGGKKAICKQSDFRKALTARKTRAGMAKGAWLGAGKEIAKRQRGSDRLTIGKGFLSWTQKHTHRGAARASMMAFRAAADLINKARHSASDYVIKDSHKRKAVEWGGRKTLKWYQHAAKKALDKP
ncbi:MAG: hypothetical protein ACO3RV_10130 [Luteolibacter sp.]